MADVLADARPPILIVSTVVGRGMYTLGDAVRQRLPTASAHHVAIEDFLPPAAVREDLERYKWISNNVPLLLYLVYKIPFIYQRKYLRERMLGTADLGALRDKIREIDPATVICISHRPAFWVGSLRRRDAGSFALWGVLGEYGKNLGWRYQFWEQISRFLSPVAREDLGFVLPETARFEHIELPARAEYERLATTPGRRDHALLVCGYWGQGPLLRLVNSLHRVDASLHVHVVCGENHKAYRALRERFAEGARVHVHGIVDSLAPLMAECASVITKPGISTLLEARAARRKLFLLRGMPVAEDNNARYSRREFEAEDFTPEAFRAWFHGLAEETGA